ncbi:hypothetical protein GWI33_006509 [Rhynchophorus ferrugineus]|uniref:Protein-cysteine N-palmitoyltransferase Rasp n=1 Tax=Rhynchophorus ferrugineus TaxID=354439 RepID=A0A834IK91_RHYFE|nr:hypothetical protein GWI33_006509 [Rhynchophorus ferrugineus]
MTTSVRLESKEIQICLIIWISTVLYCIYNFFIISQKYFLNFHDSFDDFVEGWGLFGSRKRDKADFEWETITFLVQNLSPYFLVYVGTNEFLRYKNVTQKNIQFIQIIFSLTLVYVVASYKGLMHILLQLVSMLDMWSLCGYGYLMGQLFHIKYVVLYGLSTSLTSFENIKVPHLPRCIGRVHLYSDMWKYFDPGLHTFLKGCIFIPCYSKTHNKFLSSFLCFLFVYVWHGIEDYILIWAVMNYSGVCLESLARYLYINMLKTCKFWQRLQKDNLDRMQCVLAAPLLSMSAISNFYFFAGKDVGDIFWNKAIGSGWMCQLAIFSILYCCCRISNKLRHIQAHMM